MHYDLLTCFVDYIIIGTFQAIYFRIIFRIKTHRIRMSHTRRPYISYKPQLPAFLPASRYAKDPIFNIVLAKRSAHDPSDRGDARPAMKNGFLVCNRDLNNSGLTERGIRCDQYPIAHAATTLTPSLPPQSLPLLPLSSLQFSPTYVFA